MVHKYVIRIYVWKNWGIKWKRHLIKILVFILYTTIIQKIWGLCENSKTSQKDQEKKQGKSVFSWILLNVLSQPISDDNRTLEQ